MHAISTCTSGARLSTRGRGLLATAVFAIAALFGAVNADAVLVANPPYKFNTSLIERASIGPDCNIVVGTVMDPWGTQAAFQVIGGVQIACHINKLHNIHAVVQEQYASFPSGPWYVIGTTYWWDQPAGYGMGSNILITDPITSCSPYYWRTVTDVTIDGVLRHPSQTSPIPIAAIRGC